MVIVSILLPGRLPFAGLREKWSGSVLLVNVVLKKDDEHV